MFSKVKKFKIEGVLKLSWMNIKNYIYGQNINKKSFIKIKNINLGNLNYRNNIELLN